MQELAKNYVECNKRKGETEIVAGLLEDLHFNQGQCESLGSKPSNWVEQQKGRITASSFHDVHTKVRTLLAVKTRPL